VEKIKQEDFIREEKIYYTMNSLDFLNVIKKLAAQFYPKITDLGSSKTAIEFRNREGDFVCLWSFKTDFYNSELKQLFPKTKHTEPRHITTNTSKSKGCIAGLVSKGEIR